jgi:hypothetical protein
MLEGRQKVREKMADLISRQAAIDAVGFYSLHSGDKLLFADKPLRDLPSAQPEQPKTGYISIDDAMSVFDDFMRGDVAEDETNTFLEMLKDKAESEDYEEQN